MPTLEVSTEELRTMNELLRYARAGEQSSLETLQKLQEQGYDESEDIERTKKRIEKATSLIEDLEAAE